MAGEIRLQATTGLTVKALIVGEDGTIWSGSAMVAPSTLTDANWTASLIACTEQDTGEAAGTGLYIADWPGGLTQTVVYSVVFFSGAAPSPGDLHIGIQQDPTNVLGAVVEDTNNLQTNQGNWLTATGFSTAAKLLAFIQLLLRKDAAIATDNSGEVTEINANEGSGGGSFANTTDAQEAIRDQGDVAWVTATDALDAADIRAAIGMASANLDTQLADLPTVAEFEARTLVAAAYFDPASDEVTTDAASRNASKADVSGIPTANENADALLIRDMDQVEDSAPEHSLCTVILATLESSLSGTTWTIRKTDGTTLQTKPVTVDANADPITGVT